MAKTRRAFKGAAASTTTSTSISASGTTNFTIAAYTGWPYGSDPFYVVLEPGTANEEKILVTRTGSTDTTVNIYSTPSVAANRGADGTSSVAHASGSTVYPVFTAVDADEANELASKWTSKGDLVSHGTSTFERLAVGTNDYLLTADSSAASGLKWAQVVTAGIANDAVTAAKIATGAVGSDELAADSVTAAKIASGAVGESELASDAVTAAKIASGAVGASELASSAVETAKINDSAVTTAKINDGAVTNAKLGLTELKLRKTSSTVYSATGNTTAFVSWDTEDSDADGFITATSDTITVPSGKDGLYSIVARHTGSIPGSSDNIQAYGFVVNGEVVADNGDSISNGQTFAQQTGTLYLVAGDTLKVRLQIYVASSSNTVTLTGSRLWMTRIMD